MNPWNNEINKNWKKLLGVAVNLLGVSILGCSHGTVKRDHEIWLIDGEEIVLFRKIIGGKEEVIPIKGNPDMKKFMCVSDEELDEIIDSRVEQEVE